MLVDTCAGEGYGKVESTCTRVHVVMTGNEGGIELKGMVWALVRPHGTNYRLMPSGLISEVRKLNFPSTDSDLMLRGVTCE